MDQGARYEMDAIFILIVCTICIAFFGTFYHSISARRHQGATKALHQARMNIQMGILFLSIGILQVLTPGDSGLRLFLIALIFAVGLINLYYGIKRRRVVAAHLKNEKTAE